MIAARALPGRVTLLAAAVLLAAVVRAELGGSRPAASVPAAIAFVLLLALLWWAAGGQLARPSWGALAVGCAGGALLAAVALVGRPAILAGAPMDVLAWWAPLVTVIATVEELVLRGVLFDAVRARGGDVGAIAVTAAVFAIIHLPLYGVPALGVDLAAGVVLGVLRALTGGVAAPAAAHAVADLLGGVV